jgi:hypothetical protein
MEKMKPDTGSINYNYFDLHRQPNTMRFPHRDIIAPVLDPMRQALADRVMEEFWVLFIQNWDLDVNECAGIRSHE